jgi:hypothetical protein
MLLFGFVAVGALVGGLILRDNDTRRGSVMLAAVIGVVILSFIRFVPVAGAIIVAVAVLVGFGAIITAIWDWRRRSRQAKRDEAARLRSAGMRPGPFPAQPQGPPAQQPPAWTPPQASAQAVPSQSPPAWAPTQAPAAPAPEAAAVPPAPVPPAPASTAPPAVPEPGVPSDDGLPPS